MWAGLPTTAKVPGTIYDRAKMGSSFLSEDVLVGEICHFADDRVAPWAHFVVVWVSENRKDLGVIYPNVLRRDGMIRFGQDCTAWQTRVLACKCPDSCCNCGAWDRNGRVRHEPFEEVPRDYEYKVVKIHTVGLTYLERGFDDTAFGCFSYSAA